MSSGSIYGKMKLPGFGLPVNWYPSDDFKRLDTALLSYSSKRTPLTVHEYQMTAFMSQISDKPDWITKLDNPEILQKWKSEALGEDSYMSVESVQHCFDELRFEAEKLKRLNYMKVLNGGVLKSDTIISPSLQQALQKAVAVLEDVPQQLKDWHPGSDGKVLDLVHPSLFPLIYGKTKILVDEEVTLQNFADKIGKGIVIPTPGSDEIKSGLTGVGSAFDEAPDLPDNTWSARYQWLPCDVQFEDGKTKIRSYINNLHPVVHKELHGLIEEILTAVVPMFNRTISLLRNKETEKPRIVCSAIEYPKGQQDGDFDDEGLDGDEYDEAYEAWTDNREPIQPQPGVFEPGPEYTEEEALRLNSFEKGFQVIVKLANIELTPEKPEYDGGSWHVEGQMNEHIVATGIYYYDSENITDNALEFRSQVDDDTMELGYEQSDFSGFQKMFGVGGDDSAVQVLGDVVTKGGRFITFPNIFQHCVQPFKLEDATKPGHRKILAFFLVDPHIRVISTANVPPQQRDWWASNVPGLPQVPQEIFDKIVDSVDDMMTMEEAKEERLKLMDERRDFTQAHGENFTTITFSLCEH